MMSPSWQILIIACVVVVAIIPVHSVKIGAVISLTGKQASAGGYFYADAYNITVTQWNNQSFPGIRFGGVFEPIELIVYDDRSNTTRAKELVDYLVNVDNVTAILGGYSSSVVEAQVKAAEQWAIPYVNGGGATSTIYQAGYQWSFCVLSSIKDMGTQTMVFLKQMVLGGTLPKPSKILLLVEAGAHGQDYLDGIMEWVNDTEAGSLKNPNYEFFTVVNTTTFPYPSNVGFNFSTTVDWIEEQYNIHHPDLLLGDAHIDEFIKIHQLLADRSGPDQKLYFKMISYGARGGEPEARSVFVPQTISNGLFYGSWWSPRLNKPRSKEFVSLWTNFQAQFAANRSVEHPDVLDWRAAAGHEAATVLFTAIKNAGSTDKNVIRQRLGDNLEDTLFPLPELHFNSYGQASDDYMIEQVQLTENLTTEICYPANVLTATPFKIPDPNAQSSESSEDPEKQNAQVGLIAGVSTAGIALLVAVVILGVVLFKRKNAEHDDD